MLNKLDVVTLKETPEGGELHGVLFVVAKVEGDQVTIVSCDEDPADVAMETISSSAVQKVDPSDQGLELDAIEQGIRNVELWDKNPNSFM